ncbi:MAG: adenosylcobinamide-phosphate synthase CbiB [Methanospirillum sp.]|nr:adenosylcobinamide-phosphate synthase CbiB [Methanospirillum sp.]
MILSIPVLIFSLITDRALGDPRTSLHPVAWIGRYIGWWGRYELYPKAQHRVIGILGWFSTVILFSVPFIIVQVFFPWYLYLLAAPFMLKICFAWRTLEEHAASVSAAVTREERQEKASLLVSRDTSVLSEEQALSAGYESVAENLNDSIIAPLFWFVILGLPGAALYRAVNTMDAMLGYRDEREDIGRWAARMDDLFSYIPARITGAILVIRYAFGGRLRPALAVFSRDRKKRPGYNGGIPMSLIAGGEGVLFEKPGIYRIGTPERTLREAGVSIIRTVRISTLIFSFFAGITLLLLDWMNNVYGI